jgi:hypothetical protein
MIEQDSEDDFSDVPNGDLVPASPGSEMMGEEPHPSYFHVLQPNVADLLGAPPEQEDTRNVSELIRDYLALRTELKMVSEEFNNIEKALKDAMVKISMKLREIADAQGTDTLAVRGLGTAYRNVKVTYRARDWSAFIEWCKLNDNFHCIERRPAKLAVQGIHKATGEVPPGLDYFAEQEFNIRKST